eukprot:gene12140-5631_t
MFEKELLQRKQWIESLNQGESNTFDFDVVKTFITASLWKLYLNHQKKKMTLTPNSYILFFKKKQKKFSKFIEELFESVIGHPFIYLTALYYIDKLSLHHNEFLDSIRTLKLYFGTCILISSKMHEDSSFENRAFYSMLKLKSKGYSLLDFSKVEFKIMEQLNYELYIHFDDLISVLKSYEMKLELQMKIIEKNFGLVQKAIIFEKIK